MHNRLAILGMLDLFRQPAIGIIVNGSTVKAILMKAGKKVGNTTRTISGHGKVLTLSTKGTGADGKPYSTVLVFDKQ